MVQPKKKKSDKDWLTEHTERINRENPIEKSRWYVVEVIPSRRQLVGNGHGGYEVEWTRGISTQVSDFFYSEVEAREWMDKHIPDEGKELNIRKQNLRVFKNWVNY